MSEAEKSKEKEAAPKADEAAATTTKKKPPIKLIGAVAAIMVLEGVGVYILVGASGSQPSEAEADVHGEGEAEEDALVEIAVVDDKFQNMSTGRVWIWDLSMFIKVKKKNEELVVNQLAARKAEVSEGIAQIMRRAQHAELKEPGLETLNRQLVALMTNTFGADPEGHARVERVVIPKCRGFPSDF